MLRERRGDRGERCGKGAVQGVNLNESGWPGVVTVRDGALRLLGFTNIAEATRWARDNFTHPLIALGLNI